MGQVETKFLEYLKRRLGEGCLSLSSDEICDGVLGENSEFRHRASFHHALRRLEIRNVINAINGPDGTRHYFIGDYPSIELRTSLGLT
jgi:hypothetical protein